MECVEEESEVQRELGSRSTRRNDAGGYGDRDRDVSCCNQPSGRRLATRHSMQFKQHVLLSQILWQGDNFPSWNCDNGIPATRSLLALLEDEHSVIPGIIERDCVDHQPASAQK